MARRQLGTAPSNAADTATKGYVDTATTNMVTTTGTQTLTNKTLDGGTIKVNGARTQAVVGLDNAKVFEVGAGTASVNYLRVYGSNTGVFPSLDATLSSDTNVGINFVPKGNGAIGIYQPSGNATFAASGNDTNVSLNITTKGTGVVNANGVPVVTTTGTQSLSNKTISGTNNTVTNLPASATPDAARLVATTASGDVGVENGSNTWAKIATWAPGAAQNVDATLTLLVNNSYASSGSDSAIVVLHARQVNAASLNPFVHIIAKGGGGTAIGTDSFKAISNGYNTQVELWMQKKANYGVFKVYELSSALGGVSTSTLSYHTNAPWQSAEPTGSSGNVRTNGVTAFGNPVGVKVAVPSTATSTGVEGQWAADSSYIYVCTATNTWRRAALSTW